MTYSTQGKTYDEQFKKLAELGYKRIPAQNGNELVLGKGGFGKVILARERWGHPRRKVGLKIMDMQFRRDKQERDTAGVAMFREAVANEIRTHARLSGLNHPNLVKQFSHYVIDRKVFIILEYCNSETVKSYVYNIFPDKYVIPENHLRCWFRQIVSGIHAMHSENIIHRDIKAENILVHRNPQSGTSTLKICDFGLALQDPGYIDPILGTPFFMGPEILRTTVMRRKNPGQQVNYDGKAADIWAVGCILYEMIFSKMPFENVQLAPQSIDLCLMTMLSKLKSNDFFGKPRDGMTDGLRQLIKDLLNGKPEARPTTDQILENEWYKEEPVTEPTTQYFSHKFPQQ